MKRFTAICVACLLALTALAAPAAMAAGEEIELSFVRIGADAAEKAYWEWVIAGFEAANPGVKIAYDEAAIGADMDTKLNTLFASGAGPDLIGHGILSVAQRVEMGHYLAIDEYFEAWEGKDDLLPSVLANGTYKGHVYGLGYSVTPYVFAYRTDLFEAAGLDPNAPPATWEQLAEYARLLTVKEGEQITQSGFCFPVAGGNMVEYDVFVYGNGGSFIDEDVMPTMNGEAQKEAFEFLTGFLPEVNIEYSNSETNPFVKGMAAMTLINNVALTGMLNAEEYAGKVGVALPPNNGVKGTFCGCNMLFIGRDCKYTDEAFAYIAYALSAESTLERARQTNIPVTRASLIEAFAAMDPFNPARAECVTYGTGMPRATWSTNFQTIRNQMVQNVLVGGMDIQQALDGAQAELLFEIEG